MIKLTKKEIHAMSEETAAEILGNNEARVEYGCNRLENEAKA